MSDTEATNGKTATAWSDKERLVYLFALMEQTGGKLDFKNTPRPNGRSEIACQRMVERLKTTIKVELEALKSGAPIGEATPKKTPKSTPKRKAAAKKDGLADAEGSPKKRGRKKADSAMDTKTEEGAADEV